ncbi:MAG: hypothetical protein NT124_05090 [Candidatus Dependentiae bacterium]|nr:hypothetical protein [Candidatus Dependentiae bacterium]
MNSTKNSIKKLLFMCIAYNSSMHGMNLLQPAETLLRPPYDRHLNYHTNVFLEGGFGSKSFNQDGLTSSPLHIWQTEQDSIAMLKGFNPASPIGSLSNRLNANNDGIRGRFAVCGDLDVRCAAAFNTRFFFLDNWFVSIHLPAYHIRLKNVHFTDKTENNNDADARVKALLTDNFAANVRQLGCLDVSDWSRSGVGDLALLLNWYRDFPQAKEVLKNARINWRVGLSMPTGKRADLDKLFALPFGYDGAYAVPFGLGLDVMLGCYLQTGLDVQLTHIFGAVGEYRIKTDTNQTELLLLQKTCAYKDYGLTQRFNLYVEMNKFLKGFSCLVGYQYLKHGTDHLALRTNAFSDTIANTAESLKDWTAHHAIINASYDFAVHTWHKKHALPYVSLYARIPFNGKRFTGNRTIGCVIAVDF